MPVELQGTSCKIGLRPGRPPEIDPEAGTVQEMAIDPDPVMAIDPDPVTEIDPAPAMEIGQAPAMEIDLAPVTEIDPDPVMEIDPVLATATDPAMEIVRASVTEIGQAMAIVPETDLQDGPIVRFSDRQDHVHPDGVLQETDRPAGARLTIDRHCPDTCLCTAPAIGLAIPITVGVGVIATITGGLGQRPEHSPVGS